MWSPFRKKDIVRLETIQKRFTRRAFLKCGVPFSSYSDRLYKVNLKSLEELRIIFDLCLLYKIVYKISDLNFDDYFKVIKSNYNLRRNSLQIQCLRSHVNDQWRNSFFSRVPKIWNSLPDSLVKETSLNIFKSQLNAFNLTPFLKFFNS